MLNSSKPIGQWEGTQCDFMAYYELYVAVVSDNFTNWLKSRYRSGVSRCMQFAYSAVPHFSFVTHFPLNKKKEWQDDKGTSHVAHSNNVDFHAPCVLRLFFYFGHVRRKIWAIPGRCGYLRSINRWNQEFVYITSSFSYFIETNQQFLYITLSFSYFNETTMSSTDSIAASGEGQVRGGSETRMVEQGQTMRNGQERAKRTATGRIPTTGLNGTVGLRVAITIFWNEVVRFRTTWKTYISNFCNFLCLCLCVCDRLPISVYQ